MVARISIETVTATRLLHGFYRTDFSHPGCRVVDSIEPVIPDYPLDKQGVLCFKRL
jgi:hypothetical protein